MAAAGLAAAPQPSATLLEELAEELGEVKSRVYFVTFARVLQEQLLAGDFQDVTALTREQVQICVWDAFEKPLAPKVAGRTRTLEAPLVRKMAVFKERHADGSPHFHVAVRLTRDCRWAAVKRTLRSRHGLASHFSATHRRWWSAVRYCHMPETEKSVDEDPLLWVPEASWRKSRPDAGSPPFDLFEESQEAFEAPAWRGRREKRDREAAKKGESAPPFSKMDFMALVLSKNIRSKTAFLAYVQEHGTASMNAFASRHQRKLKEFLDDALEWEAARSTAASQELTDWALLCLAADAPCPQGDACEYHTAARDFFKRNAPNFEESWLAQALRQIIVTGPCKECRVPFLVGDTNTGKSTLVESFDSLYGFKHVFHLPAMTDPKYGLRNWLKDKRFLFWDECDPVELADLGVMPVTTFKKAFNGQWFEVQLPQGYHDGNEDFRWNRGCVFTNKARNLWRTTENVSEEDLNHLRSRVELFRCTAVFVPPGRAARRQPIEQCRHHLAKWVRDGAQAFDAKCLLQQPATAAVPPADDSIEDVTDLAALLKAAQLPCETASALTQQIVALGAIHVQELRQEDWASLPAWTSLREMERRRLLKLVPP